MLFLRENDIFQGFFRVCINDKFAILWVDTIDFASFIMLDYVKDNPELGWT